MNIGSEEKAIEDKSVNKLINLLTTPLKADEVAPVEKDITETKDKDQAFLKAAFDSRDNTLLGLAH